MTDATPDLFGTTLTELANGPHIGERADLTRVLMTRLAENGLTIDQLADPRVMKRSRGTLEKHAREFGLVFADYVPRALKPRRIKAAKRRMKADAIAYYRELVAANPGYLILMRMGDFYEAFDLGAKALAEGLGLTLAKRGSVAMCGLPVHAAEDYLLKLAKLGQRVAICEPGNG